MDNSRLRLQHVFFYGLYMDPDILLSKGVEPRNPRIGTVDGYSLRVGNLATLLRESGAKASGLVYSLTHDEIDLLYAKAGLDMYVPEAVTVDLESGGRLSALCCNLLVPPNASESNDEYTEKLHACKQRLNVPS